MSAEDPSSITELPLVVEVPDQPCQRLYEPNPVLLGFDVVQYHFIPSYREGGVAVRGKPEFAYNWRGYQFWFSTPENRNLFVDDPNQYAPAWGGFCSWGIARELPPRWPWQVDFLGPPASPWNGWFLVDGVLMFNIWAAYTDRFLEERDSNVQRAVNRWKSFWGGQLHAGPFNTHCIGHGPLKNWCLSQQPSPWRQPLPTCTIAPGTQCVDNCCEIALSGGIVPETCRVEVEGGGIVSEADEFHEFGNSSISPHMHRVIKIVSSVGSVLLVITIVLLFFLCRRRTKRRNRAIDSAADDKLDDSDGITEMGSTGQGPEKAENNDDDVGGMDTPPSIK